MRGFGILAIAIGIVAIVLSMSMDVSVSTGMGGRVNNIGLMAQQQNFLILSALITFSGIVMFCLGGRQSARTAPTATPSLSADSRPCPYCAELIKNAAIKCKHCGADVGAVSRPPLTRGWMVRIPCRPGEEFETTQALAKSDGLPVGLPDGWVVVIGPYELKEEAVDVLRLLRERHSIFGELHHKT